MIMSYLENNGDEKDQNEPSSKRIKVEKLTDQPNESVFIESHNDSWKGNIIMWFLLCVVC